MVTKWVKVMAVRVFGCRNRKGQRVGDLVYVEAEFEDPRGRLFDGMLWQREMSGYDVWGERRLGMR